MAKAVQVQASPGLEDLVGGRILKVYHDRWDEYMEILVRDRWGRLLKLVIEPYREYMCEGEGEDCWEAFITYRIEPIRSR